MPKSVRSYLGQYLIKKGKITEEQLKKALEKQNKDPKEKTFLGQKLVDLGFTTEEDVSKAVAAQAGVPFISLEEYQVDESAITVLDSRYIERYNALPVGFKGDKLVTAMSQPRDIITIDDLRILTGFDIKPVIVTDSELRNYINKYTSIDVDVEQAEEDTEEDEFLQEGIISTATAETETDKPAVKLANTIFHRAAKSGASDVHLEPQENSFRIRFRIDGVLHEVMKPSKKIHPSLVSRVKVMANMDIAERRVPQDGRITLKVEDKTIDVRVASLPTPHGEKLTLRILDREAGILTLSDLGFPDSELKQFNQTINVPYGFVLVTGPTGSGKSTTLYAVLNYLNSVDKHIVTLEDPVERRIDGINQVQVHRQSGMTFSSGLRSILRNDPDIVMVGEIRDHETARIAIEASLTGHLVLSTLHTNDAAGAISRLNDMGIEPYLTTSSLVLVLAQRLVRKLCNQCKVPYEINKNDLVESVPDFPLNGMEEHQAIRLYKPEGCVKCNNTGYAGRVGVFEMLPLTDEISQMTLERRSAREISETAISQGMKTLRFSGLEKAKKGITSLEEVLRVVK